MYVDEVSIGYNAYSILKTGKDEHGKKLPLYFEAFGEYKLPAYIYSVSIAQFFFGKSNLSVRLPSIISGIATVAFLILLITRLNPNRKLALLSGFILSVSPWQTHFSRAGFEANMALFFITAGIYFLFKGVKKTPYLLISLILFSLSFYTYFGARMIFPALLLLLLIWEKRRLFDFMRNNYLTVLIIGVLFLLPLTVSTFSNEGITRALSVSFIRDVKPNPDTLFENRILLSFEQFLKNYLKNFSLEFLFFKGDGNGRHGVREIGLLYLWQLPLLIYGFTTVFARAALAKEYKVFLAWLLIAPISAALAYPNPHTLRSFLMVIPLTYFTALGLYCFVKIRHPGRILISCLFAVYFLFSYLHIYYIHYPKRTSPDWSGGYRQTIEYINSNENKYDTILITDKMSQGYIYLYYYGDFDPSTVYKTTDYQQGSGKFQFVTPFFKEKPKNPPVGEAGKTLYVSPYWEEWYGKQVGEIKNSGGDGVFKIWEN